MATRFLDTLLRLLALVHVLVLVLRWQGSKLLRCRQKQCLAICLLLLLLLNFLKKDPLSLPCS